MTSAPRLPAIALCVFALLCATPAHPQATSPQPPADDPKAAALLREATQLEQQHKWDDARKKLDEAKALNPLQPFLWSSYGYIDLMSSRSGDAIEDLQHELANHPEEENIYVLLVQVQVQQHKPQEAIVTLQKLLARSPVNRQAAMTLAPLLLDQKQYPEAEKTIRGMLAVHPDNVSAQLLLATALAREDKRAEATALLKSIAEKARDGGTLNNAAYTLADENLDPLLAEQTARRALAIFEPQSVTTFAPDPRALLLTEALVDVWDTLGWALFRQGKAADAEPWARAAWSNALAADPGYHLGMVLEKLGQPTKAMAVYQQALLGDLSSGDTVTESIGERQDALRKAGTSNQLADAKAAFLAQRSFKVPGPNKLTGSATVEIEVSAAGASGAIIVKDAEKQDRLTPVESSLLRIDFKTVLPPGSHAKLTRRGVLTCRAGNPCDFVLFSTRTAIADPQ